MKKVTVLSLVFLVILSSLMPQLAFAYDPTRPLLGVVADEELQVLEAGAKGTFDLTLKNASPVVAQMVRITLKGDHPFRSDVGNLTKTVSFINPNQSTKLTYDVNVSPVAESKLYEFDVLIEYRNYNDDTYTITEKAYVRINNSNVEPIIGILDARSASSPINPEEPNALVFNLINQGTIAAKDLRVKVSGFSSEGLILYKEVDTKTLQSLNSKESKLFYFNVIPGKDAVKGTTALTVNVSYIDDFGGKYSKDFIVYMTIAGKDEVTSQLEIKELTYSNRLIAGDDYTVSFKVTNTGKATIDTAEITYTYPSDFIAKSNSKVYLRQLKPGDSHVISFNMMAKKETPTESYHTYIDLSYKAENSSTAMTSKEYVGIYVTGIDDTQGGEGSKPKLIIENYNYGGDYVYAGESYFLELNVKNTSSAMGTRNIKVTLSSEDNVFTPVDSSSSFFIPAIGPNEVYTHRIELKTKIDANVKIYALTTKMQYEDSKGNAYDANKTPFEETEILSIAVAQPVRLETAQVNVPFEAYIGQPFYIEQEFYNMGKSTMYNMMLRLEGFESSNGTYFVGNFDAGRSDYYSAQVYPSEAGQIEGKIVYTFEDALGTVSRVEVPITVNVMEMSMPDWGGEDPFFPEVPDEGKEAGFKWAPILGGVAIVLALIIFLVLRKRKKIRLAKELEALDE